MQEQSLLEPFEEQFDLPPGSIQLDDVEGRPRLLRQRGPQEHHPCPPGWSHRLACDPFLRRMRSRLRARAAMACWRGGNEIIETKLETHVVLGIPHPGRVLTHRPLLLMLDQTFEIDLLAIFAL